MTPQAFIAKWQASKLKESAAYQEHFIDLCAMLDQGTPAEMDKDGSVYTFQKSVIKAGTQVTHVEQTLYGPETITTRGRKGFADVWFKGHFAWEYKGKHKDLGKAYEQLLQYHEALESPPLLVVCDFENYEIHTKFENCVSVVHRFTNADLHKPDVLKLLRSLFEYPNALRPAKTTEAVTQEAAEHFAKLALGLRKRAVDPHRAAHFLMKILFCLFAEDVDLLPDRLFQKIVKAGLNESANFLKEVRALFRAMRRGGRAYLQNIDHFNGGLFEDDEAFELEGLELQILNECAKLDWSQIEPAIFGTLFERSLDPAKRSMAGAHYTGKADIVTLVEPVLMVPLRREWNEVRAKAEKLRAKREALTGKEFYKQNQALRRMLEDFSHRLSTVRVLDPVCGSGNFLYVALNLLKDLEKEVITYSVTCGHNLFRYVGPEQLYGIEKDPYAVELARLVVWIGHIQWDKANGLYRPEVPILKPLDNIKEMDAILQWEDEIEQKNMQQMNKSNRVLHEPRTTNHEPRTAIEPKWPECDVIVGNPPFLGGSKLWEELGRGYQEKLFVVYKGQLPGFADLCCYWFEKARQHIKEGKCKRAGLLATQAIRGGANREVLKRIKESGDIFFAVSDKDWVLEGANVHISMVGFDNGSEKERILDGKPVSEIHPNLSSHADITRAVSLVENLDFAFIGTKKAGDFNISITQALKWLMIPTPHGKPNSDLLKPWLNGTAIVKRPDDQWIIDTGVDAKKEDFALHEQLFQHVLEKVKPERDKNNEERTRINWWLFERPRPETRNALMPLSRYIATPRVSKFRIFVWVQKIIICDDGVYTFARSDDYFFAILHSRLHEVWALKLGTRLETRPRYTPTTCFETFPFPEGGTPEETKHYTQEPRAPSPVGRMQGQDPAGGGARGSRAMPVAHQKIADAAQELDTLRTNWLNPPEWVKEEVLEFRASTAGPWARYIAPGSANRSTGVPPVRSAAANPLTPNPAPPRGEGNIGTARYPRLVPKDAEAAQQLAKRTLTNLYNQRPEWLAQAHRKLDEAVCAAYGWPSDLSDDEILKRLLELNLARAARQGAASRSNAEKEKQAADDPASQVAAAASSKKVRKTKVAPAKARLKAGKASAKRKPE